MFGGNIANNRDKEIIPCYCEWFLLLKKEFLLDLTGLHL